MFTRLLKFVSYNCLILSLSACGDLRSNVSLKPVTVIAAPMALHTSYFKDNKSKDYSSLDQSLTKDPNFDAFTVWFYHCFADFQTQDELRDDTAGASTIRLKIRSVQIRLSCPISIWLAKDATALVREHEKGHVYICQKVYELAPTVAKQAGTSLVGQSFNGMGSTPAAARKMAMAQAEREIAQAFREKIVDLADEISINYDELCGREVVRNPHCELQQQKIAEQACQRLVEPEAESIK